jgi:hypothetical protein
VSRRAPLLLLAGLVGAGCAAPPSATIRELGQPAFEEVVGAGTRFVRTRASKGGPSGNGFDAWAAEGSPGDEHRAFLSVVPTGLPETVLLAVGVAGHPGAPPLQRLAIACFPVGEAEAWEFFRSGRLPRPDEPPLGGLARADAPDPDGVLRLLVRLPRAAIPAGTERLAFPILFQFADGWLHVTWYQTIVPAPVVLPDGQDRQER